jgi:glycosyltransferase involved in cell wall biosynthesis
MNKLKICIWENISSPHQSFFFRELSKNVDLEVRYIEKFHDERVDLGWSDNNFLPKNEKYVEPNLKDALDTLEDWKERIHVIPGISYEITRELVEYFIENNVKWCHWSERSGIGLAKKLKFNINLFNLFQPLVSKVLKGSYAKKINKYALGAFSQGDLAKKDYIDWGIKESKIENLFYTIDELKIDNNFKLELKNSLVDKKIFLYVGSLDQRKGIDLLLKSFAKLKNFDNKWILLFIGHDKSNGVYESLSNKLNLKNKVFFLGPKPIEDIVNYMSISDVFVLPTLFDGWGAVLNEACQVGKAIISTTECGASSHIIKKNINGIIVKAGNINSLKHAMQFYIDNPNKTIEHGVNSKEIYYSEFTPKKNVERFLKAINKWLDEEKKNETIS